MAVAVVRACLALGLLSCAACDFNLAIVHTNDVHARYPQANVHGAACSKAEAGRNMCFAGVARRFTKIKELRRQYNDSMLLLDAGDQYQGTFWFSVHRGDITAHFMKRLGYDAMTLGNHEFDLGIGELAPFVKNVSAQFPVVSCNIDVSREPALSDLKPYAVFNRSGHRIGVVGYTTMDTPYLTAASSTATLTFLDEIAATRQAVAKLRQTEHVDVVIALGHSGYDVDQRLAAEIDDVDIVVGGHTHTFLYTGAPPSNDVPQGPYPTVIHKRSGKTALVVQDFFFGKYLGQLIVRFADNGTIIGWSGAPILLNASIGQDPDVLKEVEDYGRVVLEKGRQQVGSSDVFLNGSREQCRARECSLGNVIADAFAAAYDNRRGHGAASSNQWTNPRALAIINGGGIRASISPGPVTFENILETLPFNTMVDVAVLKGKDVLAMFEQSVAGYNLTALPGGFLQVSGFKVVYHMFRDPFSRVASVHVRCQLCSSPSYEPLDANRNYTIVIPAFLITGGDKYTVIRDNKLKHDLLGSLDADLLISYINSTSPVHNRPDEGKRLQLVFDPRSLSSSLAYTSQPSTWTTTIMLAFTVLQSTRRLQLAA